MKMIPQFYQIHLQRQLVRTDYLLLACLIGLLQSIKQVRLESLATALQLRILFESRRRKLQRFLVLPQISFKTLWFPILLAWVQQNYTGQEWLYLSIDRTSWGQVNLLIISLIVDKRAIPIYGQLLEKLGSSNLVEQQRVILPALELFKDYRVMVLGDREFCSVKLGNWLKEKRTNYCLRLKRDEYIEREEGLWLELQQLGLKPGHHLFLEGVRVTKLKGAKPFNVAAKWQRSYRTKAAAEAWFILTNLTSVEQAISAYRKRFGIEEMFRDIKSGGYHIEDTALREERFISLVVLVTLAYAAATLQGQRIKQKGVQKYVGRVKESGRTERRHSSFYIGLHGQNWVNTDLETAEFIQELMQLNPHKSANYQRGIRAQELIRQSL
jgi:hypothetical protein